MNRILSILVAPISCFQPAGVRHVLHHHFPASFLPFTWCKSFFHSIQYFLLSKIYAERCAVWAEHRCAKVLTSLYCAVQFIALHVSDNNCCQLPRRARFIQEFWPASLLLSSNNGAFLYGPLFVFCFTIISHLTRAALATDCSASCQHLI